MALVSSPGGVQLIVLDPAGWSELARARGIVEECRSLLGTFTVWTDPKGEEVTFQREDGFKITADLSRSEIMQAKSRIDLYEELLAHMMCTSCLSPLIKGEIAICGACEAKSAMDMVALARELRAEA